MKIAFVNITQNQVNRGAETFVSELSKRLAKKHEVKVIGGNRLPPKRQPFLWRFFLDPEGIYIGWFTLKILPKIWKEKYDVVIPINGGWQPAFIRIITWIYGGKMVISGQSGMGWDDRNNLWSFPNYFIAISSKAAKWAKKVMPLIKSGYIPNGTDLTRFKPKGIKLKLRLSKPVVLCVGALTETKRIDLAIKAVVGLKKVSLLVVGDGEKHSEIQKLGKELLGDRFLLTKKPYDQMPKVYRSADLFTLPSMGYYAFEIVLAEAMATGLAVVANKDEIRSEIIGNAGLLVDPTNIDEYTKALSKALKTNWGGKPKQQAKKYDWDKIADKYDKLFLSLVK